jgi:hypothetical protein
LLSPAQAIPPLKMENLNSPGTKSFKYDGTTTGVGGRLVLIQGEETWKNSSDKKDKQTHGNVERKEREQRK